MEIIRTEVLVENLVDGYFDESEFDPEQGVYAYGGKLCVRPKFQRGFVYEAEDENAVINSVLNGFPLNIMYWVDNGDGTYDCLDGQQRTLSLCHFANDNRDFSAPWLNNGKKTPIKTLERISPELHDAFMNYPLEICICKGDKLERMEWFKIVNIAGKPLFPQELRNANYASEWLTAAKKYFSRSSTASTATCPAERLGKSYTNKNANRQEILEQVISWRINSKEDVDICQYMEAHVQDKDASDLINYFESIIEWVKNVFVNYYKGMDTVNWGYLYNNYKEVEFDPDEIDNEFNELMAAKASGELTISTAKIIEYCITKDKNLLKHRTFSEPQRTTLYNRQKGICPDCGHHFTQKEMEAHHIIPWYNEGATELDNGVMLCKECHKQRHL